MAWLSCRIPYNSFLVSRLEIIATQRKLSSDPSRHGKRIIAKFSLGQDYRCIFNAQKNSLCKGSQRNLSLKIHRETAKPGILAQGKLEQNFPRDRLPLESQVNSVQAKEKPESLSVVSNRKSSHHENSRRIISDLKSLPREERQEYFERLRIAHKADVYHYSFMIGMSSDSSAASLLFKQMLAAGIKPNLVTFNTFMKKLLDDSQYDEAERILRNLPRKYGLTPDQRTYCTIIHSLSRSGNNVRAERIYQDFRAQESELDTISYNTSIAMFCRSKKFEEAEGLISEMKIRGLRPSVITFTTLMSEYGKAGRPDDSSRIFASMNSHGVRADAFALNALMHAMLINGRLEDAEQVAQSRLGNLSSTIFNVSPVVPNCQDTPTTDHKTSDIEVSAAASLGHDASKSKPLDLPGFLEPAPLVECATMPLDLAGVTTLLDSYGRNGRLDDARALFHGLPQIGLEPSVKLFNVLIGSCVYNGQLALAEHYYVVMTDSGHRPDVNTLRLIIDGHMSVGEIPAALGWIREAQRRQVEPFKNFVRWERDKRYGSVLLLDLHDMSALSAEAAVLFALATRELSHRKTHLSIVTGKGLHSSGSPVIGPAVARLLEREGFRFSPVPGNAGRLLLEQPPEYSATVALCCLLVALMWIGGALLAADWISSLQQRSTTASQQLNLARMQAEIQRGIALHARTNRERFTAHQSQEDGGSRSR